jgi:two-component sensor histidine kinase
MTAKSPAEAGSPRFDRFKTMLRGLRVSGMCVLYQDRDLNVLMVENAPDFWPSRAEIMRRGDRAIFDDKAADRIDAAKRGVLAGAETARIEVPVLANDAPRWFEMTVEPDIDRGGQIRGLFVTAVEITDLIHREQVLKTLLREVSHRSKNLLAVIQSIAMQTARFSGSLDDFLLKFRGRIQSLSQSQDLVTDSNWRGARFSELVERQLARYVSAHETRLSRSGEDCYLNPNAALHVGLALHELAVNSAVYGALSDSRGRLGIDLSREVDEAGTNHLVVFWTEHLAAESDVATIKGRFGSTVLEKVVPIAVGGTAQYRMAKDMVSYRLEIPDSQYEC